MSGKRRWNIQRKGRMWSKSEAPKRYQLTPETIEMHEGKLFWNDNDRVNMLALLLENVGLDEAVKLADPELWKQAIYYSQTEKIGKSLLEFGIQVFEDEYSFRHWLCQPCRALGGVSDGCAW